MNSKWNRNEFKVNSKWIQSQSRVNSNWIWNEFRINSFWVHSAFTLNSLWIQHEFTLNSKWIQSEFKVNPSGIQRSNVNSKQIQSEFKLNAKWIQISKVKSKCIFHEFWIYAMATTVAADAYRKFCRAPKALKQTEGFATTRNFATMLQIYMWIKQLHPNAKQFSCYLCGCNLNSLLIPFRIWPSFYEIILKFRELYWFATNVFLE